MPEEIEQQEQEEQKEQENKKGPAVSPMDPDFLLFALPFAIFIDGLDFFFEIGTLVSFIAGVPLILWLMSRTGRETKTQDIKQDIQQRQQQRQMAKKATSRVLRRGILAFIAELIPILNLLPFWIIFVFSALKEQKPETSSAKAGA